MKSLFRLVLSSVILVYFFCFPQNIYALSYDIDDFTNSTRWEFSPNSGKYILENSYLKFEANSLSSNMFPYLRTVDDVFPNSGPFDISITFKYLGTVGFGSGIALSPGTPQPNKTNIDSNITDYTLFNVWQDANLGFGLYAWICPESQINCTLPVKIASNPDKFDFSEHNVVIKYNDTGSYQIFFDNSQSPIFVSANNQTRPHGIWIGHSLETQTSSSWSSFEINDISVDSNTETMTSPIIIIPGFGASWDVGAIMSGKDEGNWQIPGFVNNYEGLVDSFKNAGYVDSGQNKNLYVFPYDWRRPLSVLASRLNEFIDTNIPDDERVNLVGHSMGGLVARTFAQNYGTAKVNKILTVGSPNMGTTKAYGVWEGALIFDDAWWSKVALELTTRLVLLLANQISRPFTEQYLH